MKTVTVNVDELEGEALVWAGNQYWPMFTTLFYLSNNEEGIRDIVRKHCDGPTVEVPAELVGVSDE